MRRLLDIAAAAGGLAVLAPLLLVVAVWIKLDSPGPVFYRARRAGRGGAPFALYKFRSMTVGADRSGPAITAAGDRRITRAGRFLRDTKLDEVPQLINVLRGDMGLIGPRPEDPAYVDLYTEEQRAILAYRPGITSPASLAFRHEERLLSGPDWETMYRSQVMPIKISIDAAYMAQRSLRSDYRVVLATIKTVRTRDA